MTIFTYPYQGSLVKKIFGIYLLFFIIQLLIGGFLLYQVSIQQTKNYLNQISGRVKEDISFKDKTWDTHRYISDPDLPGTFPVYVLSADGFVIDRWKPIHGFLDTSDVRRLLSYQSAETIVTPTNQTWRMLSQPVVSNDELLGIITVASYNPGSNVTELDRTMRQSIDAIQSKIRIKHGKIDTSNLDVRDITFGVSFQIVDKFNRIIIKNNNTNSIDQLPNYLDTSYIGSVANAAPVRQIQDADTQERFLIESTPLVDKNGYITGVVVIGKSISYIGQLIQLFIYVEVCFGLCFALFATAVTGLIVKKYVVLLTQPALTSPEQAHQVEHITFDKKTGTIMLDDLAVHIPYATNQYYLCEALFSDPQKKWEIDELLERFGEHDLTNWRKVYDARIIVNKKVMPILMDKLIVAQEKIYQINPQLASKIH